MKLQDLIIAVTTMLLGTVMLGGVLLMVVLYAIGVKG